ncbi:hypothetical protein VTO73DRAFT_9575 [Trametes versicolor]
MVIEVVLGPLPMSLIHHDYNHVHRHDDQQAWDKCHRQPASEAVQTTVVFKAYPNTPGHRGAVTIRRETLRPFYTLFLLLWPYPRKFALPPLRSSEEYFNNRDFADLLGHDSWRLGPFLPYRNRDTPLRSLYRMHAFACACDEPAFGYEAQYFYSHPEPEWRLENVPDPKDPDPVRYAILAGLVEMMALSFNDRFEMGLPRLGEGLAYSFYGKLQKEGREVQVPEEHPPAWAAGVPPVPGPLVVLRKDGEKTCARPWLDRNVLLGGAGYLDWA